MQSLCLENTFWASLIGFSCLFIFLFNCWGKKVFYILRVKSHSLKEPPGSLSVADSGVCVGGEGRKASGDGLLQGRLFLLPKYILNL